jgi:hypothetical protein
MSFELAPDVGDDGANSRRLGFSGHQTFPFRYAWIPKAVRALSKDQRVFFRDDAMVTLGVGKNMVESMRFWCQALGLVASNARKGLVELNSLARYLFGEDGWDPYLEDPATLWLLHWRLIEDPTIASTWTLAFTRWNRDVFSRDDLVGWLEEVGRQEGLRRITKGSLRRDVDVFLRTYVPSRIDRRRPLEDTFDCPLVELGLIREASDGEYQFNFGAKPALPTEVFAFALSRFWARHAADQRTLPLERILYDFGSPGAAFKLTDSALVELLERLPAWTGYRYDETAGLRTVMRVRNNAPAHELSCLERYYRSRGEED